MISKYKHRHWSVTLFFCLGAFVILTPQSDGRLHKGTHYCDAYDDTKCSLYGHCEHEVMDCSKMTDDTNTSYDKPYNYMLCFVAWQSLNATAAPVVKRSGCWMNLKECNNKEECVSEVLVSTHLFCCCDGNMCNKKFYHQPKLTEEDKSNYPRDGHKSKDIGMTKSLDSHKTSISKDYELTKTILCSIVPLIGVFCLVVTVYFMWRRHKRHLGHHQLPTMDPNLVHTPTAATYSIQLIEQKAKGRFGYVWKGKMLDQYVAVKIFPLADEKSFSSEVDIYKKTNMSHENILTFIRTEVKEDNFSLITEYHEKGSLYDFLKANTITWAQLCRIAETMTSGLSYLHDEIPGVCNRPVKPAIAHRDFKSKNVLIKSDLSSCIADFGLALAFYPNMGVNETHTQVGTRRYMAPEVLEGAICFNMDSFLHIDMYACSLVLWELMTRCTCVEDVIDDYRLPFEAEVGLQPSLEEMQLLVAGQKRRPSIKPAWYQSSGMTTLVTTMEDCWDQDAEARLSAGCVHDRITQLSRTINTGNNTQTPPPHPPSHFNHHSTVMPPSPAINGQPQCPLYVPNPSPSSTPNGNLQIYYQQW